MIQGLEAFAADDEDHPSGHFDNYLKEKIYRMVLQDEGGKEMRVFLDNIKLNKRYSNVVFSLLKRAVKPLVSRIFLGLPFARYLSCFP